MRRSEKLHSVPSQVPVQILSINPKMNVSHLALLLVYLTTTPAWTVSAVIPLPDEATEKTSLSKIGSQDSLEQKFIFSFLQRMQNQMNDYAKENLKLTRQNMELQHKIFAQGEKKDRSEQLDGAEANTKVLETRKTAESEKILLLLSETQKKLKEVEIQEAKLEVEKKALKEQLTQASTRFSQVTASYEKLKGEKSEVESQLAEAKFRLREVESENRRLEMENQNLQAEIRRIVHRQHEDSRPLIDDIAELIFDF